MTKKQQRFAEEYLIDCNATQAAVRAGYSKKTARQIGDENLSKPDIKNWIDQKLKEQSDDTVAESKEILQYLTSVLRGQSQAEEILTLRDAAGKDHVEKVMKTPSEKERLKAAELLGKRHSLFSDKVDISGITPVIISGGDQLED